MWSPERRQATCKATVESEGQVLQAAIAAGPAVFRQAKENGSWLEMKTPTISSL